MTDVKASVRIVAREELEAQRADLLRPLSFEAREELREVDYLLFGYVDGTCD